MPLCVAGIHAQQQRPEQGRLVTARARADLHHHVTLIVFVPGQHQKEQFAGERFQFPFQR